MSTLDSSIINSIIPAVASIITCIIGVRAGRIDSRNPSVRGIRERQLISVYVPMVQILKHTPFSNGKHLAEELSSIVDSNPEIIPPELSNKIERLSAMDKFTEMDMFQTKEMIFSYYNWTRRALGYPYDKGAIKKKFTPVYDRNTVIKDTVESVFFFMWALSTMFLIQLIRGKIFFPDKVYYFILFIFILGTSRGFLWVLSQTNTWRK